MVSCDKGSGGGSQVDEGGDQLYAAALVWNPVVTDEDGTPTTDVAGYRIHVGPETGVYDSETEVERGTTEATIELPAGTFHVAVTAYDFSGNESEYSNEIVITLPLPNDEGQVSDPER